MKTNLLRLLVLFSALLASCSKEANDTPAPSSAMRNESAMIQPSDRMMVLGRKLENPYTVDIMLKANENLADRGYYTNIDVRKTHLYIRFLPKSTQEYYLMAKDDALDIYDHPLDYEISQPGNTYHDATIPSDQYSWQYCAVRAGYKFPNIQYEILAELYLPEADKEDMDAGSLEMLENEAMILTGNNDTDLQQRIASFTPGGRIQVRNVFQYLDFRDNITKRVDQIIGLQGAQVRANRWFTTYRAITDVNGYYRMNSSFKNPCNYSIKWERPDFDILDRAIFGQATLDGPKKSGDWNTDITGGSQLFYATIHRGAWDYYYNDQLRNAFGLKKPPTRDNIFQQRVSLLAKDENNDVPNGDFSGWRAAFGFPHIRIFRSNRNSDEIYSTTIHELAHASHSENRGWLSFNGVDDVIVESWARCVQYYFTLYRFIGYAGGYEWADRYQNTPIVRTPQLRPYTPLFLDMCDDFDQSFKYGPTRFADQWDGNFYTLPYIEAALANASTFQDLERTLNSTGTDQSGADYYNQYK